jgi:hypothetical protein
MRAQLHKRTARAEAFSTGRPNCTSIGGLSHQKLRSRRGKTEAYSKSLDWDFYKGLDERAYC